MIFQGLAPRWFTIDADRPFAEDLARGLHDALASQGPEALSSALVLVPTRRAARALADAFVACAGGGALLLPQVRAVGDLDEGEPPFEPGSLALDLPAAIDGRRRRLELARLVKANEHVLNRSLDAAGALEWADALAAFLDACALEEIDPASKIGGLVDEDQAHHWRDSAALLEVAAVKWRKRLAELDLIDPADRQVRLLRLLAGQWSAEPPPGPLIAAGSTGTAPATADLLAVVASAPQGAVVLPGLDAGLSEAAWTQVGTDDGEQHPQGAMKRLLTRAGVDRGDVRAWPGSGARSGSGWARRRLVNEALRPADATADWLEVIDHLADEGARAGVDVLAQGFDGLSLVTVRNEEAAADAVALLLREALESPGRTAALVTPDRDLARRVSARLTRWGVATDSSAGAPLTAFPVGALLAATAELAVDPAAPVALLAVLKSPFTQLGFADSERRTGMRALEPRALRGARPRDWTDIAARVAPQRLERYVDDTDEKFESRVEQDRLRAAESHIVSEPLAVAVTTFAAAFQGDGQVSVAEAARAHLTLVETLARDTDGDLGALWAGPEGEVAAGLFAALLDADAAPPPVDASGYAALLTALMRGETVRSAGAAHPRVRILGAIEARLVRADLMVLAGLEEGVWPRAAASDPLLSRPMRKALGLPPPERRVGLSAHDFAQAACAPDVVLLRTERRAGAPAVQSRWLWRLETLLRGAGRELPTRPELPLWSRALDAPGPFAPAKKPQPRPPVAVRPRELSVTRVETWVRNPYETYARQVLRLRSLERPDAALEASTRGTAVHAALELFAAAFEGTAEDDCPRLFAGLLDAALADKGLTEHALAREAALSRNGGRWFTDFERRRRDGAVRHVERSGALSLTIDGRAFRLTAKADRIEVRPDGADILDFKTGQAPTAKQVKAGFNPQLTLTAAILRRGGFADVGPAEPRNLTYVRVTCRRPPGVEISALKGGDDPAAEAERALAGLMAKVREFDDPTRAYVPWAAPQFRKYEGAYDHLARVWEWAVLGEGEEAEG